jgi:parallel beta-helix repeat protein
MLYLDIIITNAMKRKIVAVWLGLLIMFGFVVIVINISPIVEGPTILYVGGSNPGNHSKIQWAIDNASDGDIVFVYNRTYYENVVVNKTINLIGEDRNNTIIDSGGIGDVVSITANWVNITGFTISNGGYGISIWDSADHNKIINNHLLNNSYGLSIGSSNNMVINNFIQNNVARGINLRQPSNNNCIQNNLVSSNHIGIYIDYLTNINNITDNDIIANKDTGILVHESSNINIGNNNISDNLNGINIWESLNNKIYCNNISSNGRFGITLQSSSYTNLTNNNFTENGVYISGGHLSHFNTHYIPITNLVNGNPLYYYKNLSNVDVDGIPAGQIILANCSNFNIRNLEINRTDVGIEIAYVTNTSITHNNISMNYYGISLYSSSNNNIAGNNVTLSDMWGIYLEVSSNNSITGNNVLSSGEKGIYLIWSSDNNNIAANNALDNRNGICLAYSSNYNIVLKNNVLNNFDGMIIMGSSNNNICGNNFSSNNFLGLLIRDDTSSNNIIADNNIINNSNYGLYFYSSPNNIIYHNNFINNTNQAYDDSINGNQWDNDYPSGGNYWSDYTGSDNFKGPNQDIDGSDGIGDTPYNIDADSQDNYPLIAPFTNRTFEHYITLNQGWNLLSTPLIQENQNLKKVLEMIDSWYDAVQWYDISDSNDPWKHYKVGKPFGNDLFKLNEDMGFWIHITPPGDTVFLYNGTQPTSNQTIQLYKGWNMVGYPSLSSYNRTVGLNNLSFDTHVDVIQWYDAGTKTWHFMDQDDSFVPGRGYWVHSKVEAEWEVPL